MKILVGIDGSASSMHAAKYASQLASELNDNVVITLISVHDDTALRKFRRYVPKGVIHDYLRELCENDLKRSKKYLDKQNIRHDIMLEFGQPVERILTASRQGAYDLIVLGSKGRSIFNDLLLGSVAMRVASSSAIPVTLVK